MADILHPIEEFQELVQPLVGLVVSLPWKGYGSAILLELGALAPLNTKRRHHSKGEACISVEWDWRVEAEAEVLYGSSNSRPEIEVGILSLKGSIVQGISLAGRVPELTIQFSNGHCLRSMVMVTGNPEWSIKLPGGSWIYAKGGNLLVGTGEASTSELEQAAFARAERAAARWGTPNVQPSPGSCALCASFVPLDGEGHLLDYGCCIAESGPFDGRVVARGSGCPAFMRDET